MREKHKNLNWIELSYYYVSGLKFILLTIEYLLVSTPYLDVPMNNQIDHACVRYTEYDNLDNGINAFHDNILLMIPPFPVTHAPMIYAMHNPHANLPRLKTNADINGLYDSP